MTHNWRSTLGPGVLIKYLPLPLSPISPYLRPQLSSKRVSCMSSLPWKVTEKFSILISRERGWTANDPVHERASAFRRASCSSFWQSNSKRSTQMYKVHELKCNGPHLCTVTNFNVMWRLKLANVRFKRTQVIL